MWSPFLGTFTMGEQINTEHAIIAHPPCKRGMKYPPGRTSSNIFPRAFLSISFYSRLIDSLFPITRSPTRRIKNMFLVELFFSFNASLAPHPKFCFLSERFSVNNCLLWSLRPGIFFLSRFFLPLWGICIYICYGVGSSPKQQTLCFSVYLPVLWH